MSWRNEDTDEGQDIVWDGAETGIAVSPIKGTANLQNVNISTETGEVLVSFGRVREEQASLSGQAMTPSGATLFNAPTNLLAGQWVKVTASTVTGITASTGATTVAVDYLALGGGGGGGYASSGGHASGGGGGAGRLRISTSSLSVGAYPIQIGGAGYSYGGSAKGISGSNSVFNGITAEGGGGGGGGNNGGGTGGVNGGSGGGGGADDSGTDGGTGGTSTGTLGNIGGNGRGAINGAAAGGGGSAVAGTNVSSSGVGTAGGAGTSSSITGTAVTYAAGGGGGGFTTAGAGGSSLGGYGGLGASAVGLDAVTTSFGCGGGGASVYNTAGIIGGAGSAGIVVISYTTGSMIATGGIIVYTATKTIHTFKVDTNLTTKTDVLNVLWVNPGGYYFVSYSTGGTVKLSSAFDPYGTSPITTHGTTGSITFSMVATVGSPIAKAVEKYGTTTDVAYRYYILDSLGYVWVYDTDVYASTLAASGVGTKWMLPDPTTNTFPYTGIGVLNGFLFCLNNRQIYLKPTVNLGQAFVNMTSGQLTNPFPIHNNFVLTGHQGKLHYCDGNYIGEIFPTTSFITSVANIQSYGLYTASSTTGTVSVLLGGSTPWTLSATNTTQRIPAVFFTSPGGSLPTALSQNTVYYIQYDVISYTFSVYSTITGSNILDITTGAVGTQYYNTFWPIGTDAGTNGLHPTVQFTPQRVDLPFTEEAQCLVELGNNILIGCNGNTIYPWNQVDVTPSDLIALPESNVQRIINVNNMAYIFAGSKGNIYITNGTVASLTVKVPDYCAGIAGTPSTYIEPYFSWGDAMYLRGRVYFSILDQTATKVGNSGGVWSFVPVQNMYQGQDIGLALRMEGILSGASNYNGVATVLLPNEIQSAIAPQYWSGWQDSYSVATSAFGIDNSATTPALLGVIETDLLPTGSMLSKDTFTQLEYKVSSPLGTGDIVDVYWRTNATDAWTYCGLAETESNKLSGVLPVSFQKTQWVQFRIHLITNGTSSSSFIRFAQLILR